MSWRAVAITVLGLSQTACTVKAITAQDDHRPKNLCKSDDDCGNHPCNGGVCQEVNGTLESLLVTVAPPSSSILPHLTFVTTLDEVPTSGKTKDLLLPAPRNFRGSMSLPDGANCYPTFVNDKDDPNPVLGAPDMKSLPVDITFSLHDRLLGLSQQLYFDSVKTPKRLSTKGAYEFALNVPAGRYDIYAVPSPNQSACAIPPQFIRNYPVDGTSEELQLTAAPVTDIKLTIHWPNPGSDSGYARALVGWTVDIIERVGGNPLSTAFALGVPTGTVPDTPVVYTAPLRYSPVTDLSPIKPTTSSGADLLRLRPPAGSHLPTIYHDLGGLALFDPLSPDITRFTRFPSPVKVHASMTRLDTGAPVGGTLSIVSTQISGMDSGVFASYELTEQVDDSGKSVGAIELELPPGTYNVQAIPAVAVGEEPGSATLGAFATTWIVPAEPAEQFGKVLELPLMATLTGQSQVPGAGVQVLPVPELVKPFDQAFGAAPLPSRAASGLVDSSSHFAVPVDPGRFNFSVQGPESLGFAWYVRPDLLMTDQNQDLGRVFLPRPAIFSGICTIEQPVKEKQGDVTVDKIVAMPAGSATIRAYAYLDKSFAYTRDPAQAQSLIQVAETRADEQGAFRLLLPPNLASSK